MKGTVNKGNKRYFGTAKTEYESKGKRIKKKRNPKDLIGISFYELITSDLYNLPHSGARKLVLLMNYWWKCNGNQELDKIKEKLLEIFLFMQGICKNC